MASKKLITTTAAWSLRSPSVLRQRHLSSNCCLAWNSSNHRPLTTPAAAAVSNTIIEIARRTVHVEQNRSNNSKENRKQSVDEIEPQARNRSRRTRSKRLSLDDKKVPSYKEFVHRFTVLSLYRGYLKCIRDSMPHNQEDLRDQVRKEFQMNKDDTDSFTIKQNIKEGQRRFEELMEFTGQSNKYTGESWINTKDEEDPRGRVGTGWPWAK